VIGSNDILGGSRWTCVEVVVAQNSGSDLLSPRDASHRAIYPAAARLNHDTAYPYPKRFNTTLRLRTALQEMLNV
jgi:hypothetical protein